MMYYAKQMNDNESVAALHCFEADVFPEDPEMIEISEEEYNALLAQMQPEDPAPTDEISDSEALAIILGEEQA